MGDAALTADPLFGVGCGWAFQSAEWLVEETGSAAELLESAPVTAEVVEADIVEASVKPAPVEAKTTAELFEKLTGTAVDSPLCMTCGTKMRPAGSCYVCEGCGSTSGCS